jgi:crossover junction endodeoxyribonuclease RuvC
MPERILGIDPGFGRIGYGVIEQRQNAWVHVAHGCIETSAKQAFTERLQELRLALQEVIITHKPTRSAVEELFFYKNLKTAIDVGQARGVILLTLIDAHLPIDEFTPLEVKQAVAGHGRAEKEEVQRMVSMQLQLKELKMQDDAYDALAIALTSGATLGLKRRLGQA